MTSARLSFVIEYEAGAKMPLIKPHCTALGGRVIAFAIGDKLMEPSSVNDDARRMCERMSPRELVVASMMVQGLHAKEIAHRMGIKHKTVHSFRRRIHEHLNVSNDVQAVRILLAGGITGSQENGG